MQRDNLSGVFAPMVTPFGADDAVLLSGVAENVRRMNGTGLRGYFVLGTNGEYKALTAEERLQVLDVVVQHRAPGKVVMAGCGAESTKETIDTARRLADRGADYASVLMPSFFAKKMTTEVMARHALAVADASPIPVVLYNNPSVAAGVTIRLDLLQRVASHPNIAGIKDSSKETYLENLKAASPTFCVLAGSANYFTDLLRRGGTGGVLSLANVLPDACVALYEAARAGRRDEEERLDRLLVDLNTQVSGKYGVAGVKAAMTLCGFVGGAPRRPFLPLGAEEVSGLRGVLERSGLLGK
ncbi:MAG TPA: dihydrodipicolinate synthase family protein [Anaeromyxobacter sp.]|nr:dihydrodipicolinate synthase family protein [Anaeromyxobacter sp.]